MSSKQCQIRACLLSQMVSCGDNHKILNDVNYSIPSICYSARRKSGPVITTSISVLMPYSARGLHAFTTQETGFILLSGSSRPHSNAR